MNANVKASAAEQVLRDTHDINKTWQDMGSTPNRRLESIAESELAKNYRPVSPSLSHDMHLRIAQENFDEVTELAEHGGQYAAREHRCISTAT